jgi:hypothetical protein
LKEHAFTADEKALAGLKRTRKNVDLQLAESSRLAPL